MKERRELVELMRRWLEGAWMRSLHEGLRSIRAVGLSPPQLIALAHLYHGGGCGVREIARHLDVTGAAASQFVDRLVGAGLVERSEDPGDRRVRRLTLTASGRKMVERSAADRVRWLDDLVGCLSDAEREKVLEAARSLLAAEARIAERGGPAARGGTGRRS